MSGRADARKMVEEMGKKNGYIPDGLREMMQRALPKDDFDSIMQITNNLKHTAGASVKTLAQNLYSSSAKFVFELLQNYDDNHYDSAGDAPSVTFEVHADRIVASCNETGFTEENVKAICAVGQSSKTNRAAQLAGDTGYTGEKGIGFKSVFMAAEDVHIQSGDYSFRFKYAMGDSGLGMTTPLWTEHDETLDAKLSHVTMTLRTDGAAADIARRKAIIHDQFNTIHDSILLFMKKLESITVVMYDDDDKRTCTTSFSIQRGRETTTVKRSVTTVDASNREDVTDHVKKYIMIKHVVADLAPSENRRALDGDVQASTNGIVVLGFPIDDASEPVQEREHIFAFLPVKKLGFKFLIHADFVTQANREDIVVTSSRNLGLGQGIAQAFVKAVVQFTGHPTLAYTWMRYLPQEADYPWDGFWRQVITAIRTRLAQVPVMKPEGTKPLKYIRDSRRLLPSMVDGVGTPLFRDIAPHRYLSQLYQEKDLRLLTDYGLMPLTTDGVLARVEHDLASPSSVMKSSNDPAWHTRAADFLYTSLHTPHSSVVSYLQLCPLRDGRWVSVSEGPVFYSQLKTPHLTIPGGLDLAILDAAAATNISRKRFFDRLGVSSAPVAVVRRAIIDAHKRYEEYRRFADVNDHTRFMYLTHHLATPPYGYENLRVWPRTGMREMACSTVIDMYIADGTPYGADLLLPVANGAPGLEPVFVLTEGYLEAPPMPPVPQTPPFKEWLIEFLGIRRHLRLVNRDGTALSDVCKYVAEHRPEQFMGFLHATWGNTILTSETRIGIVEQLSNIEVLCEGGKKVRLGSTYLPLARLKTLASRFLDGEFFPWLQLDSNTTDQGLFITWAPMGNAFGLGYSTPTIYLLLDVLKYIKEGNSGTNDKIKNQQRIYELYLAIQMQMQFLMAGDELHDKVRKAFLSQPLIYAHDATGNGASWRALGDCLWSAPLDMRHIFPIARYCERSFPDLCGKELPALRSLFSTTLQIPDCSWEHLVRELSYLRNHGTHSLTSVKDVYSSLYATLLDSLPDDQKKLLRDAFAGEKLIYVPARDDGGSVKKDAWYTSTQCLWTATTPIAGMVTLKDTYPSHERFFVNELGVRNMSAKMVYDKLAGPPLSIEETKHTIQALNGYTAFGKIALPSSDGLELAKKPIFPVRFPDGTVQLCDGQASFALVDRQSLADQFAGQAKFLDFDMDGTRSLQPFLEFVGKSHKRLSDMVREITFVAPENQRPLLNRDRDIQHKARALFSLALAYNSPRTRGSQKKPFYALLRHAKTMESGHITAELHLVQDGEVLKVKREAATCHLQHDEASLTFYVPWNNKRQELCFNATLPKRLCDWLMCDSSTGADIVALPPVKMVYAAQAILCAKRIAMADILDHHGINLAPVPPGEEDNEDVEEDDHDEAGAQVNGKEEIQAEGKQQADSSPVSSSDAFSVASPGPSTLSTSLGSPPLRTPSTPSRLTTSPVPSPVTTPAVPLPVRSRLSSQTTASSRLALFAPRPRVLVFGSEGDEASRPSTPRARQNGSQGDGGDDDVTFLYSRPRISADNTPASAKPNSTLTARTASRPTTPRAQLRSHDDEDDISSLLSRIHISPPNAASSAGTAQTTNPLPQQPHSSYHLILAQLVHAARHMAMPPRAHVSTFAIVDPTAGPNPPASMFLFTSTASSPLSRYDNQWFENEPTLDEKRRLIGAAGELLIFELLSRLLPGFSRDNWQSPLRQYVRYNLHYRDMTNWAGTETSSMVYNDVDGTFTALLIDKGYLASDKWSSAKPRYFIEVKTTIHADVKARFLMSASEFKRMQDCAADRHNDIPEGARPDVYMIMRVFGLGAGNVVGFQVLVDPENMRQRGELDFREGPWKVSLVGGTMTSGAGQ